jgi:hypothetical protein
VLSNEIFLFRAPFNSKRSDPSLEGADTDARFANAAALIARVSRMRWSNRLVHVGEGHRASTHEGTASGRGLDGRGSDAETGPGRLGKTVSRCNSVSYPLASAEHNPISGFLSKFLGLRFVFKRTTISCCNAIWLGSIG